MQTIVANYQEEQRLFQTLLAETCQKPILLIKGNSGAGKTTLLRVCRQKIPNHINFAPIELRDTAVSVAEIFYRIGGHIGWNRLTNFTEQVSQLQETPTVTVDSNFLAGINNRIHVALQAESQTDRDSRRVALTEAWFNDLAGLQQPLLVILDTYEKATTEVKHWIAGPFLARVARIGQVRVLLAGQDVPDQNNIEWDFRCEWRELRGVHEADHWLPVIEALNKHTGADHPLSFLQGICQLLHGQPLDIMNFISSLPEKEPSP